MHVSIKAFIIFAEEIVVFTVRQCINKVGILFLE